MVQRQQAHTHAEPQGRRACGDERCQHGRRRAKAVVVEVVLGDPHGVVAERFGGQHLRERRVVDRLLTPRVVPLHQEEQSEVHPVPPFAHRGERIGRRVLPRATASAAIPDSARESSLSRPA